MNNKTLEIRITENSFYFREGEIYQAHQDGSGFLVCLPNGEYEFISDGEAELIGGDHE